ncbi:hypothetical protein OG992_18605 [Micromonospora sp. NBC_00362]|uniref:hypothetical protein n=1 Tax=Micromonospora sp. NBC_00362 TaxID=2975975 RepID=UPI00224FE72E|nr:hypothetical protein [Micromonospora sp. NBC_00362]MCX5119200.1 hypothetical protein [Micromonospora sp. NBC_00362]
MSTTTEVPERVAPIVEGGLRPQLAPHAAVGTLVVAAVACRVAVHAVGDEQTVAVWVAGAAFAIAVVAAMQVRRRVFDKRARRRALAFLGVAVGWLTGVTLTGLSLGAVGLLMAVAYALSMHWWRQHPVGLIQPKATRSGHQRLWAENNGASDGALPGSRLTSPEQIAAGVRFALKLRAGKQTLGMAQGAMEKLRGGLFLQTDQELIIERHPTEPEPTALLTIVTKSPVKDTVFWPGPQAFDPQTGDVRLGPFTDGEGVAAWRVYTETRLKGGYLQGGTEGGKSRTMEMLAITIAASTSHPTVICYADGQGGASSPLLMEHADFRARTPQRALAMLEGMYLLMQLRQDENAVMGLRGFTPTEGRPGVLGFIDECHKLLSKVDNPLYGERTQWLVSAIASEGGKVGVALILASQQSTLDAFGGAGTNVAEKIRGNLLTGNGAMFKGKDANAKTVFQISVDPRSFPDMPGYAYLVNPRPGARSAPFRSYYLTDEMAEEWPKRIVWRSLDAGSAAAWGTSYLRRDELAEEALEAARQRIAARRAGIVLDEPAPAQPTTGGDGAALESFGLAAFPTWTEFVAQAQQEALKALGPSHDKVVAAIRDGHTSPQRIADAIDLSVRRVHQLLGDLAEAGRVRGGGRQYEVAA